MIFLKADQKKTDNVIKQALLNSILYMSSLRHFNGKEIYKVFNFIVIRERQIHTRMRCYYTPNIIAET